MTTPPVPPSIAAATGDLLMTLCRKLSVNGTINLLELEQVVSRLRRDPIDPATARLARKSPPLPTADAKRRGDPFRRLLVRPFEHLMTGETPMVSRVFLPNYFTAMELCLGEAWEGLARRSRTILKLMLVADRNAVSWERYYDDPRVLALFAEAMQPVAERLATPEGRAAFAAVLRNEVGGRRMAASNADYLVQLMVEAARDAPGRARNAPGRDAMAWGAAIGRTG